MASRQPRAIAFCAAFAAWRRDWLAAGSFCRDSSSEFHAMGFRDSIPTLAAECAGGFCGANLRG